MVEEHREAHASEWAVLQSVAPKLGCTAETLRKWVRQAQRDAGHRPGLTTSERRSIRVLDMDLPLVRPLAVVAAGTPILCEANIVERLPAAIAERFQPRADYLLTVRGDSMNRTGLCDGDIAAIHRTTVAESGQVVVARFGDEVTLKRFVRLDERHVELRPESHNPAHEVMKLDLAKHILDIDGIAVGALIGGLHDAAAGVDANV